MFKLKDLLSSMDPKGQLQMILDMLEDEDNKDITQGLNIWAELNDGLSFYKDWEMTFRKALDKKCFPSPKQGTNMIELANGYKLTSTHKTNIKLDEAMLPFVRKNLEAQNVSLDDFLTVKYSLNSVAYKGLLAVEKNLDVKPVGSALREMIISTPAAPSMEIVTPKDEK